MQFFSSLYNILETKVNIKITKSINIYHTFTSSSYTSFKTVIIFKQSSQPKPLLFLSLLIIPHYFITILRWLCTCLGSHCMLNFWLIFVATLIKYSALKVEEGLLHLSASSANISSNMWDIGLDHVKCLPLHFSFCVELISTKKKLQIYTKWNHTIFRFNKFHIKTTINI